MDLVGDPGAPPPLLQPGLGRLGTVGSTDPG
jgi:hypothetical protein